WKHIFQIPDIIQYSLDYISDRDEISTDIRLKFESNQGGNDRFPVHKILDEKLIDDSALHPTEKEKLTRRTARYSNFKLHYEKINKTSGYTTDMIGAMTIKNTD